MAWMKVDSHLGNASGFALFGLFNEARFFLEHMIALQESGQLLPQLQECAGTIPALNAGLH